MSPTRTASLAWELKLATAQEKLRKNLQRQIDLGNQITLDHQKLSDIQKKRPTK